MRGGERGERRFRGCAAQVGRMRAVRERALLRAALAWAHLVKSAPSLSTLLPSPLAGEGSGVRGAARAATDVCTTFPCNGGERKLKASHWFHRHARITRSCAPSAIPKRRR